MSEEPERPKEIDPAEFDAVRLKQQRLAERVGRIEREVDILRREADAMIAEQRILRGKRKQ